MNSEKEVILLSISGDDKPGLTSALTGVLSGYKVNILDIGQAVIHDQLSLGILFEVPEQYESAPILKDILFRSYKLGINARFTPITEVKYNKWVSQQGKERYIISLIARKINAQHISRVTEIIYNQNLNIDIISRLSGRMPLNEPDVKSTACVEFSVRGTPADKEEMKSKFLEVSGEIGVDIAFQADNIYRRNRRLVCFDMDSTLIQTEVIVDLARIAGAGEEVHKITEEAMRGNIDFKESFRKRIALLKGIEESRMKEIAENLPVTEGAEKLISTLGKYGFKTVIISGGFTYFGEYLKDKLGIDYLFANKLEIVSGKLTGNYLGEIIDGQKKAEILKNLALNENIDLEQVIAVGDGSNDLPMLSIAGLGIAYHAKPVVRENAQQALSTIGLDAILYLMGFRERELELHN